jgi:ATP:ADP antiporter, AAA family
MPAPEVDATDVDAARRSSKTAARLATVTALVVIAGFVAGKAARDAVVLSTFPVTWLPAFIGATAILSLPLVVIAGRMMARLGPALLMPRLYLVSAVMLGAEYLAISRWPQWAAAVCFFHLGSLGAVLVSGFWSVINERFDARSAKRLIGKIGLGATVGGVVGGLIAERSGALLPPGAILLVLAGLQLVSAAAIRGLAGPEGAAHQIDALAPGETMATMRAAMRSPLLRQLGLLVLFGAVAATALDYLFKAEIAAEAATGGDRPLRLLGMYHTATNVLTAVAQVLLSRAVVTRLGVARSIGVLPGVVTAVTAGALVVPGLWSLVIARGAEMITRSSVYRAAYELVFAPLPEQDKRSTKVVLDVGAERVGDLVGAQLTALLLFTLTSPRTALIALALLAAVAALAAAALLPRAYTAALEDSLRRRASDAQNARDGRATGKRDAIAAGSPAEARARRDAEERAVLQHGAPWLGRSTLAETGDLTGLSLLNLELLSRGDSPPRSATASAQTRALALARTQVAAPASVAPGGRAAHPSAPPRPRDPLATAAADLRSGDVPRVQAALAELPPELAALAIPLLAWHAVAAEAIAALRAVAPRATGALADAMLDPEQEFAIRRRLPALVAAGAPELARWALWRALSDARFEVRYRAARALAELREAAAAAAPTPADPDPGAAPVADVLELVRRELSVSKEVWRSYQLLDGDAELDEAGKRPADNDATRALLQILRRRSATGLYHVFTLLGLAWPAEPMRLAFQGVTTDDRALRATALEYLESILPPDLRALLWPFIASEETAAPSGRPRQELAESLRLSYPSILANLQKLAGSSVEH